MSPVHIIAWAERCCSLRQPNVWRVPEYVKIVEIICIFTSIQNYIDCCWPYISKHQTHEMRDKWTAWWEGTQTYWRTLDCILYSNNLISSLCQRTALQVSLRRRFLLKPSSSVTWKRGERSIDRFVQRVIVLDLAVSSIELVDGSGIA